MSDKRGRRETILGENFGEAVEVIRGHRLRSSLLIVGVAIAVTTILAIVAILEGLAHKLEEDFASAARPYVSVQRYDEIVVGDPEDEMDKRPPIVASEGEAIRARSRTADKVDFYIDPNRPSVLRYRGEKTPMVGVAGCSADFPLIFSFNIESGRFFTPQEVTHRTAVVVLGYGPASYLFPNTDPIGKKILIEDREYTVIGTFEDRRTTFGSLGENFAAIPYTSYLRDLAQDRGWHGEQTYIIVAPRRGISLEECREEITALMRQIRGLGPSEENDFGVLTSEAYSKIASRVTGAVFLALVIISSIGLLVGGIGVMNIMLISVAERTREIGIRMAVGASRRDVLMQILVESGLLTGIGGLSGIALGLGAAYGITRLANFPFEVPLLWVAIAVVFSVGIGVVFGLYPANRAARLDPIEALRYE